MSNRKLIQIKLRRKTQVIKYALKCFVCGDNTPKERVSKKRPRLCKLCAGE